MSTVVGVFPAGGAGDGALADALTHAFAQARDARDDVILLVADEPVAAAAVASLTRSLALEWAPDGQRVNAVRCASPEQASTVVAWLDAPPARMLTGAVLEAR